MPEAPCNTSPSSITTATLTVQVSFEPHRKVQSHTSPSSITTHRQVQSLQQVLASFADLGPNSTTAKQRGALQDIEEARDGHVHLVLILLIILLSLLLLLL